MPKICAQSGPGGCYCQMKIGHLGPHDFELPGGKQAACVKIGATGKPQRSPSEVSRYVAAPAPPPSAAHRAAAASGGSSHGTGNAKRPLEVAKQEPKPKAAKASASSVSKAPAAAPVAASKKSAAAGSSATSSNGAGGGSAGGSVKPKTPKTACTIVVPTFEVALQAALSEDLPWATFKDRSFREKQLHEIKAAAPPTPGLPGQQQFGYLVARDGSKQLGFIVWREVWGKRSSYYVELEQLAFPASDPGVAHGLIDGMISRLDRSASSSGGGQITTKLMDKVPKEVDETWRALGFASALGSNTFTRDLK